MINENQGRGVQYFDNGEHYEGEWAEGESSGWGRMYYADKSVYEGEWLLGKRHGLGLLLLGNGLFVFWVSQSTSEWKSL
jgi:hypothetical protein